MQRAQGTLEYLLIVGVVITMALVVVGVLSSSMHPISSTADNQNKIISLTKQVALIGAVLGADGNGILEIQNNSGEYIVLTGVMVDGVSYHIAETPIPAGGQNSIILAGIAPCEANQKKTINVKISYRTADGLEKPIDYGSVTAECAQEVKKQPSGILGGSCGNDICDAGETANNCAADCAPRYHTECKDSNCTQVEGAGINQCTANPDCLAQSAVCGNGICEQLLSDKNELDSSTAAYCPQDCTVKKTVCGNSLCEVPNESHTTCPIDCLDPNRLSPYVLCIYNSSSEVPISKQVCDYYVSKRPGSHEFDLNLPATSFGSRDIRDNNHFYEWMDDKNFNALVEQPVLSYVKNHPEQDIRYLAVAKGVPQTVYLENIDEMTAAAQWLSMEMNADANYSDVLLQIANPDSASCFPKTSHFDPSQCITWNGSYKYRFAVSYLTGFNLNDIEIMIDKAQAPPTDFNSAIWVDDVTTGFLNDTETSDFQTNLRSMGASPNNIMVAAHNDSHLDINASVAGYAGHGVHHVFGYNANWIYNNVQMATANRSILTVYESWFGLSNNTGYLKYADMGLMAEALTPTAFGGADYSRSISGGGAVVYEPGYAGIAPKEYFLPLYANGLTLAEAILDVSQKRQMLYAVGDPIMTLEDEVVGARIKNDGEGLSRLCVNDSQCESGYCSVQLACAESRDLCPLQEGPGVFNNFLNQTGICWGGTPEAYATLICNKGTWQLTKCPSGCKQVNGSPTCFTKADSAECTSGNECASKVCAQDLQGVYRCTPTQSTGMCNKDANTQIPNDYFVCTTGGQRKLCMDSNWTNASACPGECNQGNCLTDPSKQVAIKGKTDGAGITAMTLTTNPPSRKIRDIFSNINIENLTIWLERPDEGSGYPYTDIHYAINGGDDKWQGPEGGDSEIRIGEGFVIYNSTGPAFTLQQQGNFLSTPQEIQINAGYSLIGVPFCDYNASRALAEIRAAQPTGEPKCVYLSTQNFNGSDEKWFSPDINQQNKFNLDLNDSDYADFNLPKGSVFYLDCNANQDFNWTPRCP